MTRSRAAASQLTASFIVLVLAVAIVSVAYVNNSQQGQSQIANLQTQLAQLVKEQKAFNASLFSSGQPPCDRPGADKCADS